MGIRTATCTINSLSPYGQSKPLATVRKQKETAEDHEKRCWRERIHSTPDGYVFIPPMAFKFSIAEAAKFLSKKIPGKNRQTYTKHFESGIMVLDPVVLSLKEKDVEGEWMFLNADGKRGSGSRVWRCMPVVGLLRTALRPDWIGSASA